ncbi:MAG: DUF424 domain-containing protein [Sulfolobales archaeon]
MTQRGNMTIDISDKELFWVKVHRSEEYIILAICDQELLGKTLNDSRLNINLRIDPLFYGGELLEFDEIIPLLRKANIVNAIGNKIIRRLSEIGYISSETDALEIDGIKHVQILVFEY